MSLRQGSLVVGVAFLVACGGGGETNGHTGAAGEGGEPSGGKASGGKPSTSGGEPSDSGGGGTSGGKPSDSGGAPSGGNENAGSGGDLSEVEPPTALPGLSCDSRQAIYEGTIGGSAISETLELMGSAAGSFTMHGHSNGFSGVSNTELSGDDPIRRVAGALRFPDGSSLAGQIWCIDDGLQPRQEGNDFAYIGHLLGECPGASTSDTVYMCDGDLCEPEGPAELRRLGGTLNGVQIPSGDGSFTSASARVWTLSTPDYGSVIFSDTGLSSGESQPVTGAIVGLPGGQEPGAVYCVSGTWSQESLFEHRAVLDSVSYLGNCNDAPPTDTLEGCLGY